MELIRRIRYSRLNFFRAAWRKYYLKKISRPFISGDAFASLCEYSITSADLTPTQEKFLCEAKSLFVRSDYLHEVLTRITKKKISARIIVAGNSDQDTFTLPELPPSVERIYIQNSFISDDKRVWTLPIGIENLALAGNGFPRLMKSETPWNSREIDLLVGPFSLTHQERQGLIDKFRIASSLNILVLEGRISTQKYAGIVKNSKYVLCPRGNGEDTHRTWEALYRGAIPILKENAWSQSLAYLNLPLILVKEFEPTEIAERIFSCSTKPVSPSMLSSLWINYWEEEFKSTVEAK